MGACAALASSPWRDCSWQAPSHCLPGEVAWSRAVLPCKRGEEVGGGPARLGQGRIGALAVTALSRVLCSPPDGPGEAVPSPRCP